MNDDEKVYPVAMGAPEPRTDVGNDDAAQFHAAWETIKTGRREFGKADSVLNAWKLVGEVF